MKWTTLASIGFLLAPSTSYTHVDIEAGETRLEALMPVPFRCQRSELEQLFAQGQPFLCLTFNSEAAKFASKHPYLQLEIIASTESLALIGYR